MIRFFIPLLLACAFACTPKSPTQSIEKPQRKATVVDVERGIRQHIKRETEKNNGFFALKNDSTDLSLRLVRVHTEYLSVLSKGQYFACVDLADEHGDVYDVDFFLSGNPEQMDVTETTVHKLNGKPYYAWKQNEDKTWGRVPTQGASSALMGVVEGADHFTFEYRVVLPVIEDEAELWIPLPNNDPYQNISLEQISSPVKEQILEASESDSRAFYFTLGPDQSEDTVTIVYDVQRKEKGPYAASETDFSPFLNSSLLLPTGGQFAAIVDSVLEDHWEESKLVQGRALYDYVVDNVRYAKQGKYGTGDAVYACDSKSGNCTEFHSLFISLARTAGIPARFAIGAAIPSNRDEGGVDGYHCWAEFYAEEQWWPVDISEGNKYSALSTYYFGHHPANRIEFSRGRDLVFNPGPTNGKIPFFAYPVFEMNEQEVKIATTFTYRRKRES
ncbi:transglutaminase domain-containing protein [Cryomorphaceae bacterium]|nr:transglutaminase domain-containing protein [Cryomorphaceae bacterium]